MVNYLSGGIIEGSSTSISSPSATGQKLLKRSTPLSSDGNDLSSGTFTAKDNLTVLIYAKIAGGNSGNPTGKLRFNSSGSSDNHYAQSYVQGVNSGNGNLNTTQNSSRNGVTFSDGMSTGSVVFTVAQVSNMSDVQKLFTYNSVFDRNGTTASNVPCRISGVGKYDSGSLGTNITSVDITNGNDGTFLDTDSEIIVLGGNNDESDSGTNFWQKLGYSGLSAYNSSSPDYLCQDLSLAKKKYLWIREHKMAAGNVRSKYTFNNSTSNYASRKNDWQSSSGSTDSISDTSGSELTLYNSGGSAEVISNTFILNTSTSHKLGYTHTVEHNSDGAGNTVTVGQFWWKWCSNDQIESLTIKNDGSGNFGSGSEVTIWGAD